MKLEAYLEQRFSRSTVKYYLRDITIYLEDTGEEKAMHASWSDVMAYIENLRGRYSNANTVNRVLYAIKAYYSYLTESGTRDDHPCRDIKLRDAKGKETQLQDLFTTEELETLLQREERYSLAGTRNQVITSLLIYQGVTAVEIANMHLQDIKLQEGSVYIKPTRKLNERTLALKPTQIMLFYQYIQEVRPRLLKNSQSDTFIITLRGSTETGEGIAYLLETIKDKFPGRKLNPGTIRASVISNLLKAGHDLRVVQVLAGHKKISSTERYRQGTSEAMKAAVVKYHPLNHN
jgi:integrase/recombinase XerD